MSSTSRLFIRHPLLGTAPSVAPACLLDQVPFPAVSSLVSSLRRAADVRARRRIADLGGAAVACDRASATVAKRAAGITTRLARPSGLSDDEVMEKAAIIVNRAVENGMTSVQVFRFPNHICTDNGRAINQVEEGWETTLTGIPKEIYQLWYKYFRPRGYRLSVQIIDFPGGMPGDVGMTLSWG